MDIKLFLLNLIKHFKYYIFLKIIFRIIMIKFLKNLKTFLTIQVIQITYYNSNMNFILKISNPLIILKFLKLKTLLL